MVNYILRIPYESGSSSYTATFNIYNYAQLGSFIAPSGYKIPDPEYLFSLEQFLHGKPLDEHTKGIILSKIQEQHRGNITKILGHELVIRSFFSKDI